MDIIAKDRNKSHPKSEPTQKKTCASKKKYDTLLVSRKSQLEIPANKNTKKGDGENGKMGKTGRLAK